MPLPTLEACITRMQEKYGVQVYLEPGEAWALNAGYLVTTVLDTLQNGEHQPRHPRYVRRLPHPGRHRDALPPASAGRRGAGRKARAPSASAGRPASQAMSWETTASTPRLTEGDRLLFGDMAIYTTCKNNTFNGMPLPPIWTLTEDGTCRELVRFGYNDFKMRLGHRA